MVSFHAKPSPDLPPCPETLALNPKPETLTLNPNRRLRTDPCLVQPVALQKGILGFWSGRELNTSYHIIMGLRVSSLEA